jgi:hypothetical protein
VKPMALLWLLYNVWRHARHILPTVLSCLYRALSVFSDVTEWATWRCQFRMFACHFSYLFSDGTKSRTVLVASANAREKMLSFVHKRDGARGMSHICKFWKLHHHWNSGLFALFVFLVQMLTACCQTVWMERWKIT